MTTYYYIGCEDDKPRTASEMACELDSAELFDVFMEENLATLLCDYDEELRSLWLEEYMEWLEERVQKNVDFRIDNDIIAVEEDG